MTDLQVTDSSSPAGSLIYQISDGRFWSVADARFVSELPEGAKIIILSRAKGSADAAYLKRTLESYGLKVGYELMSLDEARAEKLAEINAACDAALASLTATYPERELFSFERQEREARALIAGDASDTAHIAAIAKGRGIPVEDLAQKIVAKADAFSVASGTLIGHRQALETQVEEAATKEDMAAVVVSYDILP